MVLAMAMEVIDPMFLLHGIRKTTEYRSKRMGKRIPTPPSKDIDSTST